MDRGAWQATINGVTRVRHDLMTEPPNHLFFKDYFKLLKIYRLFDITMLILSNQKHRISFHLFASSISSMSQYFQCAGISSPWLNLFRGILFFLMQLQTDFLFLMVCHRCLETQLIFVC